MSNTFTLASLRRLTGIGLLLAGFSLPAKAVPVAVELSLLVDVSGSVSTTEYNLQRSGYAQAFQSAAVQNAILASAGGAIAVNFIQWSSTNEQVQSIGWTLINSVASANAFADLVNAVVRAFSGGTEPDNAINFAVPLFNNNGFEGARNVIDVSGDGSGSATATAAARDAALAAGITTINGIVIGGEASVATFYQNNVVGGAGGFLELASSFADFGDAIQRKLVREIAPTPVPEPASLAVLAIGLAALGAARRRRA